MRETNPPKVPPVDNDRSTQLMRERYSTACRCGRFKQRGETFCRQCWDELLEAMRASLTAPVGPSYEAAYDAAAALLDDARAAR